MTFQILGIIIGSLILITSLYYLYKEKHDPEARKIYTIAALTGAVVACGAGLLLMR